MEENSICCSSSHGQPWPSELLLLGLAASEAGKLAENGGATSAGATTPPAASCLLQLRMAQAWRTRAPMRAGAVLLRCKVWALALTKLVGTAAA